MLAILKGTLNVNEGKALASGLPVNASTLALAIAQQAVVDCATAEKTSMIKHQLAATLNAMNSKCQQTVLNSAKIATSTQETAFDSHLCKKSSKSQSKADNPVRIHGSLDESSEEYPQLDTSMHKSFNEDKTMVLI